MTLETAKDVTGLVFIVDTQTVEDKNRAIADAIDFDYLPMVGQFYNCAGKPVSDFEVGAVAYYKGVKFAQLTSDSMATGWEHSHGELLWEFAIVTERDDVDMQRNGWMH